MSKKPALHPRQAVGRSLQQVALGILGDARSALQGPPKADAITIHDIRKAIKSWRSLLRLLPLGEQGARLRGSPRPRSRARRFA